LVFAGGKLVQSAIGSYAMKRFLKNKNKAKSARAVKASGEDAGEGLARGNRNSDMNTQDLNNLLRGKSASLADDSLVQSQVAYVPGQSKELLGPQVNQRLIGNGSQGLRNSTEEAGNLLQAENSMFGRLTNKSNNKISDELGSSHASLVSDDPNYFTNLMLKNNFFKS
jgi:hypothetical protein